MTLRVGIVGVGKMGLSHYAIINAHEQATVAAVCDTSGYMLSVLEKYTHVPTYASYQEMMDQGALDAVVVATPTSTHFSCAKYALERDLHVFVEKPLTLAPTESHALSDLALRRKRVNQVGFHNRFIGTFLEARRIASSGLLGEITHIHGSAFGPVALKQQNTTWRSKKTEGGGCLHDYACHVVDLMNFLVGPPKRVVGASMQSVFSKDVEDAVYALFSYGDNCTGSLEANWSDETYRKMTTTITLSGTRGKLIADRQELRVYLRAGCASDDYVEGWNMRFITDLQKPVNFYLRGEEYSAQIDSFIAAIQSSQSANECSFESSTQADIVLEQIAIASKKDC